jgi:hypothetical protein
MYQPRREPRLLPRSPAAGADEQPRQTVANTEEYIMETNTLTGKPVRRNARGPLQRLRFAAGTTGALLLMPLAPFPAQAVVDGFGGPAAVVMRPAERQGPMPYLTGYVGQALAADAEANAKAAQRQGQMPQLTGYVGQALTADAEARATRTCPLRRVDLQLVRCDELTGAGAVAPGAVPQR